MCGLCVGYDHAVSRRDHTRYLPRMMFVYECPSLQDGERELKEDAARDDEVEGAIVLLDQGTNVDGIDEVRYSALGTDSCTNHSLCAEIVTEYLVLFWLYQVPRIMIIPLVWDGGWLGVGWRVGCGWRVGG